MNRNTMTFVFRTLTPTMVSMIKRIRSCQATGKPLYMEGKRDFLTMDALVDRGLIRTEPAKNGFNIVVDDCFDEFLSLVEVVRS